VEEGDKGSRLAPENPGSDQGETADRLKIPYGSMKPDDVPVFSHQHAREPGLNGGGFFLVRGRVVSTDPTVIETAGDQYEVFAHDEGLRGRIRSWEKDSRVKFLGQLGLHRGRQQFVVFDPGWILE
jgi:hypothetical protein